MKCTWGVLLWIILIWMAIKADKENLDYLSEGSEGTYYNFYDVYIIEAKKV